MRKRSWLTDSTGAAILLPVIGLATIQAMRRAGASALSIDAGRTLVLDGEHVFNSANEGGIAIVGRTAKEARVS